MGLSIKGYVLEPPRLSTSNAASTANPNTVILDQVAYNAAFPEGAEPNPRVEYFVLVLPDGSSDAGRALIDAKFGWTKNEGTTTANLQRFDFDSSAQAFKLLPGAPIETVGVVGPDANTSRLKVTPPIGVLAAAPYRLSYGSAGSGTTLLTSLVNVFGSPTAGTVEILQSTGELNWNASDVTALDGQTVRWQRQQFYTYSESKGKIGLIDDADLLLSPLPATGQYPMIRIGFGLWLEPVEVPNDSGLAVDPPAGSFKWSAQTGRLKFNPTDVTANAGAPIYYDGVLIQRNVQLPRYNIGTVAAPTPIPLATLPPSGGDLIFYVPAVGRQFPYFKRSDDILDIFPDVPGSTGTVQVSGVTGVVYFSEADQVIYGGFPVEFIPGDLPIEHGVALRLYRTILNPGNTLDTPKDVTLFYPTTDAVIASPIIGSPQVLLPSAPIDDPQFLLQFRVEQGTGSFTGVLPRLDGPSPVPGLGYFIDFEAKQFKFANRRDKASNEITLPVAVGATPLPDPLILGGNYEFELEIAPNSGVFAPLVMGQDALVDPTPGILTFTSTSGLLVAEGSEGVFSGTTFTDAANPATTQLGDLLVVRSGPAEGVYNLFAGTLSSGVTTDVSGGTTSNVIYEIRRNREIVADRFWSPITLVDPNTKVEKIRLLGMAQNQTTLIASSTGTFPDDTTLSSLTDFVAAGVQLGDTLELLSGPEAGTYRTITIVETNTIQVATPFNSISGSATFRVYRRLRIPVVDGPATRFRFGQTTFSTTTTVVADDGLFSPPATIPSGTVEVSEATGNLNFSSADLTPQNVYWVRKLTPLVDYQLQPLLAFINFTERFLTGEEALVTYIPLDANGDPLPLTAERVSFLIRKELTNPTPRTAVTNTLFFNPQGRTVASNPAPQIYRGGRPQTDQQIVVNTAASSILFLPDQGYMTDTLPHGSRVLPDERVYVDYNVYEAVGGERSITLLNNMSVVQVALTEDASDFTVTGDQTGVFLPGYLLRVERDYVYRIATSTYDLPTNQTTVTLSPGEYFQDNFTNPKLFLASGTTPISSTLFVQSYFRTESSPYQVIPRGMNKFKVFGDKRKSYQTNTVLLFTDPGGTYFDFYMATGSTLTADGWTEVTVTSNMQRQYLPGSAFLKASVRPILPEGSESATTLQTPVLTEPYGVYRKKVGEVGQLLESPLGYQIDAAGALKFSPPLAIGEEIGIFYTGNKTTRPGVKLRASYTHSVAPTATNGLLNQFLYADFTIFSPDSWYYRVETLTNFSGETARYLKTQAQGSVQTNGPRTSNASSPTLYEQGRESVYFPEGHIANQDYVARKILKYINDGINKLEDTLQSFDGRIVGANSGRFRFDGITTNPVRTLYSQVTNDLDDQFEVSPFPIRLDMFGPPPTFTFLSSYRPMYQASVKSRVYPERRESVFGFTTNGVDTVPAPTDAPAQVVLFQAGDAEDGEEIFDLGLTNVFSPPVSIGRRHPRSLVVQEAAGSDIELYVDNVEGSADYLRPPWSNATGASTVGGKCMVYDPIGLPIVFSAEIAAIHTSPPRIELTAAVGVTVPKGSTVTLAFDDEVYQKNYRLDSDVGFDSINGKVLYLDPYWPFDGSIPAIPNELCVQTPYKGDYLQLSNVKFANSLLEPYRFPALDGVAANDSGDTGIPMKIKTFDCEKEYLGDENTGIVGLIAATVPAVPIANISLDPAKTLLTSPVPWPAPAIQVHDLVRFTTGPNASDGFRRILTVTPTTVTVDAPFTNATASDSVVITAGADVTSGLGATFNLAGDEVTEAGLGTAAVGQTIIFTSAPHTGLRRQIVAKPAANTAKLDYPVLVPVIPSNYRVSRHLSTFSRDFDIPTNVQEVINVVLTNDVTVDPTKVDSEVIGITRFFEGSVAEGIDGNLSDLLSPSAQAGTVNVSTLTGTTDFLAANVNSSCFVYIQSGANLGFYKVASVLSPTSLTVTTPFPSAGAVTYRIVTAYGMSLEGLNDLLAVLVQSTTWATDSLTWISLLSSTVPVIVNTPPIGVDPQIYANALLTSDLTDRLTAISNRQTVVNDTTSGPIVKVETTLKSRDLLYDKRYIWIDGRANVEKGFLYMQQRAVLARASALVKQRRDLIKLASLESLL